MARIRAVLTFTPVDEEAIAGGRDRGKTGSWCENTLDSHEMLLNGVEGARERVMWREGPWALQQSVVGCCCSRGELDFSARLGEGGPTLACSSSLASQPKRVLISAARVFAYIDINIDIDTSRCSRAHLPTATCRPYSNAKTRSSPRRPSSQSSSDSASCARRTSPPTGRVSMPPRYGLAGESESTLRTADLLQASRTVPEELQCHETRRHRVPYILPGRSTLIHNPWHTDQQEAE